MIIRECIFKSFTKCILIPKTRVETSINKPGMKRWQVMTIALVIIGLITGVLLFMYIPPLLNNPQGNGDETETETTTTTTIPIEYEETFEAYTVGTSLITAGQWGCNTMGGLTFTAATPANTTSGGMICGQLVKTDTTSPSFGALQYSSAAAPFAPQPASDVASCMVAIDLYITSASGGDGISIIWTSPTNNFGIMKINFDPNGEVRINGARSLGNGFLLPFIALIHTTYRIQLTKTSSTSFTVNINGHVFNNYNQGYPTGNYVTEAITKLSFYIPQPTSATYQIDNIYSSWNH